MSAVFNSLLWNDIYLYWQRKTNGTLRFINQPVPYETVKVMPPSNGKRICYPSWLKNHYPSDLAADFNQWISAPVFDRTIPFSDESVSRSAGLILDAATAEIQAAVWLFLFSQSFRKNLLPFPNNLILEHIETNALGFLSRHFRKYPFELPHQFPHLFINASTLTNITFENDKAVIDYAILNAYMLYKEYTLVVFDSMPDIPPKSLRFRT